MPENVTSQLIHLRQKAVKLRQLERLSSELGVVHTTDQRHHIRDVRDDLQGHAAACVTEKMHDLLNHPRTSNIEILETIAIMGRHVVHIH